MRIALRTGGGRGVYELAGRQGNLSASELFGRQIFYELTPELVLPGLAIADRHDGKPRIKLDNPNLTTHVYRLLAATLLLPKPKRELKTAHGSELLLFEAYSMTVIKVDVAAVTDATVTLRPVTLLLQNAEGLQAEINFTSRMARVLKLWEAAKGANTELAQLVRALTGAVKAIPPSFVEIERRAKLIADYLKIDGDALPIAEARLGLSSEDASAVGLASLIDTAQFGLFDEMTPQEAQVRRVKMWRMQVERGASGRAFAKSVSGAYDFRCIFTGQKLPRLDITNSPGVDSAHILPWSTHDLDSVRNGICLSKHCHWAFDEGILRLDYVSEVSHYVVSIPDRVRQAATSQSFDLKLFESVTGMIPSSRLPANQNLWPCPAYIAELNNFMDKI